MNSKIALILIIILQGIKGGVLAGAGILATRDWQFWAIEILVLVMLILAWTHSEETDDDPR